MNIFKKLFGSQTTSKETKQEENKNFDVLKYDGVRALRMQQFEYAAKCFVHAIELNADDLECRDYLSQAYISLGDLEHAYEQLQEISEKQSDNIAVLLRMAEVAYLNLDRSTATSLGVTTFYDDKSAYEYDVESSMLTFEEAKHFSQLLLSRYVNIVEIGGALTPITITDINSEISDADNATNSIKFKYKYSSHHFPITIDYGNNIFDDPFYRTFD